ncbi:hypothetical protein R3P38DRAFT_3201791 [Favolaschia claudopus]|uniref:F-box domain-containing protein n=1 Tax=Favolaschia claudopus TaxID=2862362 RepID=A0AAW0AV26_9AGAR
MNLTLLPEELILGICSQLCVEDILRLRQTSRVLSRVTRTKSLWNYVLNRHGYMHGSFASYLGGYERLEASTLEALACRVARLDAKWKARDLSPVRDFQLRLPQSITWLRLVAGTWLFVASSDNYISKLTCWDVHSVFRVTTNLSPRHTFRRSALAPIHVITFQKGSDGHVFSELARVDGSSHVLMLAGDVLGCALRAGTIVPHLVNWKENKIHLIPQSDVPERPASHGDPKKHAGTRQDGIAPGLYSSLSGKGSSPPHQTRRRACHLEAVVSSSPAEPSILRLLIISAVGIEMCLIDVDILTEIDDEPICPRFTVATRPKDLVSYEAPWYRLGIGPHFETICIPSQPFTEEVPPIAWSQDTPEQSALWGFPIFDVDDILGVTVVGNCFGELSIYDHVGNNLAQQFTVDLPQGRKPILTHMPTPRNPQSYLGEADPAVLAGWSQDGIDLGGFWLTDWWTDDLRAIWHGKWEHAYGFPGKIIPQAYVDDDDYTVQRLLFRLGDRYLLYTADASPDLNMELMSWPVYPSNRDRFFSLGDAEPERYTRPTAITEGEIYGYLQSDETDGVARRNRWAEQAERGGRPHANLLAMPPV